MLEDIFSDDNDVKAVIASYAKVRDDIAAKFSITFYELFVSLGNNLKMSFDKLADFNSFKLHKEGLQMRNIEMEDKLFFDPAKPVFQWGLFYKDPAVLSYTIASFTTNTLIAEKENRVNNVKQELADLQKDLQDLSGKEGTRPYKNTAGAITATTQELQMLQLELQQLRTNELANQQLEDNKKLQADFTEAIKKINYADQRTAYQQGKHCTFAAFAAMGDADSLIDLLLIKFQEEFELKNNRYIPFTIDFSSSIGYSFWQVLAVQLNLDPATVPDNITENLVTNIFFGGQEKLDAGAGSQQHILLKVNINQVSAKEVAEMVKAFWLSIHKYWKNDFLPTKKDLPVKHKIIMLLVDESADEYREKEFQSFIAAVNQDLETKLDMLPLVKPLTMAEIENWLTLHELDKVGLAKQLAPALYAESDKGKIRKVLSKVKEKTTIKELQLFKDLKI